MKFRQRPPSRTTSIQNPNPTTIYHVIIQITLTLNSDLTGRSTWRIIQERHSKEGMQHQLHISTIPYHPNARSIWPTLKPTYMPPFAEPFSSKDFSRWMNGMDLNGDIAGLPNRASTLQPYQHRQHTVKSLLALLYFDVAVAMTVICSFWVWGGWSGGFDYVLRTLTRWTGTTDVRTRARLRRSVHSLFCPVNLAK